MTNNPISINYSVEKLRILVEEYITQQRSTFTLKDVCSYVLYWAMEDGHTTGEDLFEGNKLAKVDSDRISGILERISCEGRILSHGEKFEKLMN